MIIDIDEKTLSMSLSDVHAKGMFSLVISGNEPGKLIRVFIAKEKLRAFDVAMHTHRYPVKITAIKGKINQIIGTPTVNDIYPVMSVYNYKSFLNGGEGLSYINETPVIINEFTQPISSCLKMGSDIFHTMSCSKGSIWIVEEMGFETDSSKVIGIPFTSENLYNKPEMFQVNHAAQLVLKELNLLESKFIF